MDKGQLDRLIGKIDKIVDQTARTEITLAKQSVILDEHIRRTNILESKVDHETGLADRKLDLLTRSLNAELRPIRTHIDNINGVGKAISLSAVIVGIVIAIMKLTAV